MKIGSIAGTGSNIPAGSMGIGAQNDSVSRELQRQIANAQKKLQEVSSDGDMPTEEKLKKRQELQQEIANLNQQLCQHQAQQRKEQQAKRTSMDDLLGTSRASAAKPKDAGSSMPQASMQAVLSADASMKQAKVQGSVATQMEGRAGVLRAEIRQDAGRGADTEKKEAALADIQKKAQAATASQMSMLADANQAVEEAVKAEKDRKPQEDAKGKGIEKKDGKVNTKGKEIDLKSEGMDTKSKEADKKGSKINTKSVGADTTGKGIDKTSGKAEKSEDGSKEAAYTYTSVDIYL